MGHAMTTASPTSVSAAKAIVSNAIVTDAKSLAFCGLSFSNLAYTGVNDALSAPSPKSRRNKFGNWNAIKNASIVEWVPNTRLCAASRARPENRLTNVNKETVRACFSNDMIHTP